MKKEYKLALPELNSILAQKVEVAPGLIIIRIVPDGWELPDFVPGQYTVIGLPPSAPRYMYSEPEPTPPREDKLVRRAYSVASSSIEKQYVEFYVRLVTSGSLTPRLFGMNIGDKLWMSPKMKGMFTMDEVPQDQNIILFATGTGVAPYMSMLRSSVISQEKRKYAVVHSALNSWDLGYRSELLTVERLCPNFKYIPLISEPDKEPIPWGGQVGFVQDLWKKRIVQKIWEHEITPDNTRVFLCGHPEMIREMLELLEGSGFREHTKLDPGSIHLEKYW
jgi:ferredoxin--NADP+ reductase